MHGTVLVDDQGRLTRDTALLPPLRAPGEVLAGLSPQAAGRLGLAPGIPVLVGAGDYPMALLGSGVASPGMGSDVTGTSTIITLIHEAPVIDRAICNLVSASGHWGAMTLLDAGGDAVRWAPGLPWQRALLCPGGRGCRGGGPWRGWALFPVLPVRRADRGASQLARAVLCLSATHCLPELHRAVLEGVAFSVRRVLDLLPPDKARPERIVAASGGAKNALWLKIKARIHGVPCLVPQELKCGILGAAGDRADLTAAGQMVRIAEEVAPEAAWMERYNRMMPIFARLNAAAQGFHDDLDAL